MTRLGGQEELVGGGDLNGVSRNGSALKRLLGSRGDFNVGEPRQQWWGSQRGAREASFFGTYCVY